MPTITIKAGALEVSYEGDQAFIETGLPKLLKELTEMPIAAAPSQVAAGNGNGGDAGDSAAIPHTTSQIANLVGGGSGPELALAAALHLTLSKGDDKVSRSAINMEMKGAGSFYKESYSKNLTPALNALMKDKKLNPVGTNLYSVPSAIRKEYQQKLASE